MQNNEDKEILTELQNIMKNNESWENNIDNVAIKLNKNYSIVVKAKSLWLLGEIGLKYPIKVEKYIECIVNYLYSEHPKLRERAVNALGRIGRADSNLVIPYLDKLIKMRDDTSDNVRHSVIWACENIAINNPDLFFGKLDLFYELLFDSCEKVRIEAPEMFRVIGKRKPSYVKPYLEKLQYFAENDTNRIVRIHSAGAIRITKKALNDMDTKTN